MPSELLGIEVGDWVAIIVVGVYSSFGSAFSHEMHELLPSISSTGNENVEWQI